MSKISLVVSLLALIISAFSLLKHDKNVDSMLPTTNQMGEESHEVVNQMIIFQWLTNKLYFAGMAGNLPLTEFYLHELEEKMEEFAEGEIVDEGVQLSVLMRAHGLSALDLASNRIKEQGLEGFSEIYSNFISGCNNCHAGTSHEYIKIVSPTVPVADNQDFQ